MCTSIKINGSHLLFGRNLDVECSYDENVVITPRNYRFKLSSGDYLDEHYSIIGMASVKDNYPLYYDASNEHGLSIAALKYDDACYFNSSAIMNNVASYEFIGYMLCKFKTVNEVLSFVSQTNITNSAFSKDLPPAPLHWIICDRVRCVTLESMSSGIICTENTVNILTNMPDFKSQLYNLNSYICNKKENMGCAEQDCIAFPGDTSSQSRFVRAFFGLSGSKVQKNDTYGEVNRFFKILESVGRIYSNSDKGEITLYSSCCDTDDMIYYYKTYTNSRITAIRMNKADMCGTDLIRFALRYEQDVLFET